MKKLIFTFCLALIISAGFSQTTYYWVGGAGPSSFTSNTNWNTQLDGLGTTRVAAATNDILIYDGANIGGTVPTTGQASVITTSATIGQLKFQNGSNVFFTRSAAGNGTITVNGDVGDDVTIDATSTLIMGGPLYNYDVNVTLGASATAYVYGTVYFGAISTSIHPRAFFSSPTANSITFAAGSVAYSNDSSATACFNASVQSAVLFKNGSSLYYYTGRSPVGSNSTTQYANFEVGSKLYFRGSNVSYVDGITAYGNSSWCNNKTLANLYIQNGAVFKADGPAYKIDTLVIDNSCTFTGHTSGNTSILGDVTVNGTMDAPGGSTNVLVLGGNSPQTVSGSGTITVPSLTVANFSDVTLSKSVSVATTCNIVGKINFGAANQITGTANFTSRVNGSATSVTGNTTAGSYQITAVSGALSGNTGLKISGTGLDVNTSVVGFAASNFVINLSKPALSTTTGTTFTFSSDSATLVTSNTNGMDTLTGSVVVSGSKSFQSGTNYTINAATSKPFGISSGSPASITTGSLTINANATTNYNLRLTGTLTLNSGKLTIRPTDTVRIMSGNTIGGAPFSSSKYIISSLSGANAGVLRIDNFSTTKLFPIGTATNYLPATLTPLTVSDFAASAFEGVTSDGTPTGTAFTPSMKSGIVDAVWTLNRVNGSGDCVVQLNWPTALEGSSFSSLADAQIGIGKYNGASWDIVTGSGNNTTNIATSTFSSFSPFSVGQVGYILPLQFKDLSARFRSFGVEVGWNVLNEDAGTIYTVERSSNGTNFSAVGTVTGNNMNNYNLIDASTVTGKVYYRIKATAANGRFTYSNIVFIQPNNVTSISVYPNPVSSILTISGLKGKTEIRISNTNGQVVLRQTTETNSFGINVTELKAGSYVVEVLIDGKRIDGKPFIKE